MTLVTEVVCIILLVLLHLSHVGKIVSRNKVFQRLVIIAGSATLHQWKKLATPNLKLTDNHPGVHVKGEVSTQEDQSVSIKDRGIHSEDEPEEDDEPIMMRIGKTSAESTGRPSSDAEGEVGLEGGTPSKTSSILASLLNNPSSTSPTKGSVGQVLAEALDKASKQSTNRRRAESLANLSRYFSDKERSASTSSAERTSPVTSPTITKNLPRVFPNPTITPVGSGLLSKVLRSTNLGLTLTQSPPVTTSAKTTSLVTTTTSSSFGLTRNSSGDNLLSYFQKQSNITDTEKRRSVDSSELMNATNLEKFRGLSLDTSAVSMPTLMRHASSGDLSRMDTPGISEGTEMNRQRLFRSNSIGNIRDLASGTDKLSSSPRGPSDASVGFFGRLRRTSIGSLTDIVKSSNLSADPMAYEALRHAPSMDSSEVFHSGHSPPSPTRFDGSTAIGMLSTSSSNVDTSGRGPKQGLFSGSRLSSLAGVRGLWSSSNASTSDVGLSAVRAGSSPTRSLANPGAAPERIEKINKALAFEDFGGLGIMSFFGSKKSN